MEGLVPTRNSGHQLSHSVRAGLPAHDGPHAPLARAADLRQMFMVLVRRKFLVGTALLSALLPTAILNQVSNPTYLSTATLQIEPESVKVLPYRDVSESIMNSPPDFELYMKTQSELLKNPTLIERTAKRLTKDFPELEQSDLETALTEDVRVERVAGSQIIRINCAFKSPALAAAAANAISEEFIRLHFERRQETTRKAAEFLQTQLRELKTKLESTERELLDYAQNHSILKMDSRQENVIRQKFGFVSSEVTRVEGEAINRKAAYDALAGLSADELPEKMKNASITALETSVHQVEQELSRLSAQFDENWPAVVRKKDELAVVQAQLTHEKAAALARAKKQAQVDYVAAQTQYDMLAKVFKEQSGLVDELNQATLEYNNHKRDLETSEQLYQGLLQRLKETGVSAGVEFGNIQIADKALANPAPYRPRKMWNLALAAILGLSVGVGLAFVVEQFDRGLRNPADIEALGLPLLGWLPQFGSAKNRSLIGAPSKSTAKGSVVPSRRLLEVASWGDLRMDWRFYESCRSLCASMLLSKAETPPRTILVTSAAPKEGKTTVITHLGYALAETGISTLLIDADFRNPALSRRFGSSGPKGLSVFLAGGELEVKETGTANLFLMPSGPTPPNPIALFSSPRLAGAMQQLVGKFRFILVDGPPVLSVADAKLLASKVDGVILVVKAGDTPEPIIQSANLELMRAGACMLGAAVNQVNLRNPEYAHYRKYYYGPYAGTETGRKSHPA
jgi:polysaccharide biosynthesis transport protein